MLPDLRVLVIATVSTFLLTVCAGLFASIRLLPEPLTVHGDRGFGDTPINRIAVGFPAAREPGAAAKQPGPIESPVAAPKAADLPAVAPRPDAAPVSAQPAAVLPADSVETASRPQNEPARDPTGEEGDTPPAQSAEQGANEKDQSKPALAKEPPVAIPAAPDPAFPSQAAARDDGAPSKPADGLSDAELPVTTGSIVDTPPSAPSGKSAPKVAARPDPSHAVEAPATTIAPPQAKPKVEKPKAPARTAKRRGARGSGEWSNTSSATTPGYNFFTDFGSRASN